MWLYIPYACYRDGAFVFCRNELTSLPHALTELSNLERLNASDNKLTELPAG